MKNYVYRMSSTGDNSKKYGNCEVCNKPATEVFQQVEGYVYESPEFGQSVTHHNCSHLFGHRECLISKQQF